MIDMFLPSTVRIEDKDISDCVLRLIRNLCDLVRSRSCLHSVKMFELKGQGGVALFEQRNLHKLFNADLLCLVSLTVAH